MFHIPRRDRRLQQQNGRRPIGRAVAVILCKSIISSAHGICIRKRLPRQCGVHVGIEDGCQCHDAFAVEKLSCVHRGILDSFTGYAYCDAGQQESKKALHGAMDSVVVVTGSKRKSGCGPSWKWNSLGPSAVIGGPPTGPTLTCASRAELTLNSDGSVLLKRAVVTGFIQCMITIVCKLHVSIHLNANLHSIYIVIFYIYIDFACTYLYNMMRNIVIFSDVHWSNWISVLRCIRFD